MKSMTEIVTALLICAASEIEEADELRLPEWALDELGAPDFRAIVSAGRELLAVAQTLDALYARSLGRAAETPATF